MPTPTRAAPLTSATEYHQLPRATPNISPSDLQRTDASACFTYPSRGAQRHGGIAMNNPDDLVREHHPQFSPQRAFASASQCRKTTRPPYTAQDVRLSFVYRRSHHVPRLDLADSVLLLHPPNKLQPEYSPNFQFKQRIDHIPLFAFTAKTYWIDFTTRVLRGLNDSLVCHETVAHPPHTSTPCINPQTYLTLSGWV